MYIFVQYKNKKKTVVVGMVDLAIYSKLTMWNMVLF